MTSADRVTRRQPESATKSGRTRSRNWAHLLADGYVHHVQQPCVDQLLDQFAHPGQGEVKQDRGLAASRAPAIRTPSGRCPQNRRMRCAAAGSPRTPVRADDLGQQVQRLVGLQHTEVGSSGVEDRLRRGGSAAVGGDDPGTRVEEHAAVGGVRGEDGA
jgi:hypothetical protein